MSWFKTLMNVAFGELSGQAIPFPAQTPAQALLQIRLATLAWGLSGCPVFRLNANQAALFAATTCSDVTKEEIIFPFSVFGLLLDARIQRNLEEFALFADMTQAEKQAADHLAIGTEPGGYTYPYVVLASGNGGGGPGGHFRQSPDLADLCGKDWELREHRFDSDDIEQQCRGINCMARMAVGLLLSLDRSGTMAFRNCEHHAHHAKREKGFPEYNEFRFTMPVNVNVRQGVSDYIAGGGHPLAVQTLVCGHWKLQPHGPARALRKRLHILPYWRGPLDGAVAIRSPK
jgi:hypothetical protein